MWYFITCTSSTVSCVPVLLYHVYQFNCIMCTSSTVSCVPVLLRHLCQFCCIMCTSSTVSCVPDPLYHVYRFYSTMCTSSTELCIPVLLYNVYQLDRFIYPVSKTRCQRLKFVIAICPLSWCCTTALCASAGYTRCIGLTSAYL